MRIAITFDVERDIPHNLDTCFGIKDGLIKILDLLDKFHIKGTFFCTGNIAEDFPKMIRLIEEKGHEIACHGLNHERFNKLNLEKCYEIIYENKVILQNLCQNSKIIGFRAPYLKPPKSIFTVLKNLGFEYDSSIDSKDKLEYFQKFNEKVQEFYPSKYSIYFRMPYPFLKRKLFKHDLLVLYFHPWEAINMKKVFIKQTSRSNAIKNIFFRLDRWLNTGDSFLRKLNNFIQDSMVKKVEFITLNQLIAS
ncbi:MAG: polysaccharide deacetylase family protein [Promethearchaeota archaeon]